MMKTSTHFSTNYFQPSAQSAKPRQIFSGLSALFSQLWQALTTSSSEPRIWPIVDRFGTPSWKAYDPVTGRSAIFSTEEEVYAWLERRYYQ